MTIRLERLRDVPAHRTQRRVEIRRYLPSIVLAGYGGFIVSLFLRHIMTWYINPAYVGPTTVGGVVLLGFAGLTLRQSQAAHEGDSCCSTDSCSSCAAPPRLWVYGVLSIPLFLAILIPPHSLAAFSARQRGPQIAGLGPIRTAAPLRRISLSVDTRSFGLQDWIGALSADPNPRDFQGKPVILTGMVIHSPGSVPSGYMMVLRYQITCCIADAKPEGLMVRDTTHGALQDNQWVTVRGSMTSFKYQGQEVVAVQPKQIARVKAGNPYMY